METNANEVQESNTGDTGNKRWYVVHAYSGFEKSVAQALRDRIVRLGMQERFGDVLVPTEEVVEMRSGQKRRSERKFFPGYVLVQIATQVVRVASWRLGQTTLRNSKRDSDRNSLACTPLRLVRNTTRPATRPPPTQSTRATLGHCPSNQ